MKHAFSACVLIAAAMTLTAAAQADGPPMALAKEAYDRGLASYKRGDKRKAAEEFARADALAPSAVALQAALDAAIEADDAPLGAELLERSKREPATPRLASSITAAHLKFRGRVGRLRVVCPSGTTCFAKLDDKPMDVDKIVWARNGPHAVVVQSSGETQTKVVEVGSDSIIEVSAGQGAPSAPIAKPVRDANETLGDEPRPSRRRDGFGQGLPPIYFYGAAGLTAALLGATTYFAIDTESRHDAFTSEGCVRANYAPCEDLQSRGETSQTLTNVFLVSTVVVGIGTAIIGVVLTDWRAPVFGLQRGGAAGRIVF